MKITKRIFGVLLLFAIALSLYTPVQAVNQVVAVPTTQTALVDGNAVSFYTYNTNGSNYIKLRDLAYFLRGTTKPFEVGWDSYTGDILITTGIAYTPVGGENTAMDTECLLVTPSTAKVYVNGNYVYMKAYNINGYNYFKLRDVASAIDFGVTLDGEKNTIEINTSVSYTYTNLAPNDIKIGVILVGDAKEYYSFAHIEGVEAARETLGLSREQIIYKYRISEDEKCYDTAYDLIKQGCKIIFANSFGHESYILQAAKENPNVLFFQAYAPSAYSSGLSNMCNYFAKIHESRYVSGVVAGLKLKELIDSGKVTDPHIGFVGAYPYAEVTSSYTAFFLGIQSVVPSAYMDVCYSNSWYDPTRDAEVAKTLIDRGCVIIGQFSDSPKVPTTIENAYKNGKTVYYVGFNNDFFSIAPHVALTSAMNNWGVLYTELIQTAIEGNTLNKDYTAGYAENGVWISTLGKSCAAGTAEKVKMVEASIASGELHVFDCSKFTVNGKHLTSYDQSYDLNKTQLIWDNYFHESELISAPQFNIRIDGITELLY